jgi:hypothetical protein
VPGGGALRKTIYETRTGPAILDAVEQFFAQRFSATGISSSANEPATAFALQL